jgi:hypothetical protein
VPGQSVAPGSLISVFGTELAGALAQADSIPLSTSLGNVSVAFNGIKAPILFRLAGSNQCPASLERPRSGRRLWQCGGDRPTRQCIVGWYGQQVSGRFLQEFQHSVRHRTSDCHHHEWLDRRGAGSNPRPDDGASANRRDHRDLCEWDSVPVNNPVADGANTVDALRTTTTTPEVLIGGKNAVVAFSGLAPQFVGVNQLNVVIPEGTPTGDAVPLQLRVGGQTTSDKVTIAVR